MDPTRRGAPMRYLMLVCWDAERMDAQTEPVPTDAVNEESFPWLDDLRVSCRPRRAEGRRIEARHERL